MIELIMVGIICFFSFLFNLITTFLFLKWQDKLVKYIALKNDIDVSKVDEEDKQEVVYHSIGLDDELEAEVEKINRKKIEEELE